MFNHVFGLLNLFNGWLASFLPGLGRVCLYGAFSGVAALFLYSVISNQGRIAGLKSETRRLRKQMRDTNLKYGEMIQLSKINLVVSMRLLGHTLLPSILSSLPPISFILWLTIYHSYTLPTNGKLIAVTIVPETAQVVVEPSRISIETGNGKRAIAVEAGQSVRFASEGRTVYEGIITDPPVGAVRKKLWRSALVADEAGYIHSDVPVDEIMFDFPRKRFIEVGPTWLVTWEFPFFLSLLISAVTTKLVLKIE